MSHSYSCIHLALILGQQQPVKYGKMYTLPFRNCYNANFFFHRVLARLYFIMRVQSTVIQIIESRSALCTLYTHVSRCILHGNVCKLHSGAPEELLAVLWVYYLLHYVTLISQF